MYVCVFSKAPTLLKKTENFVLVQRVMLRLTKYYVFMSLAIEMELCQENKRGF